MTDRVDDFKHSPAPKKAVKDTVKADMMRKFVLGVLLAAAKAGDRCPSNDELLYACRRNGHHLPVDCHPSQLARAGHCISEVYAFNYRVVEIQGHRTAEAPGGRKPYKITRGPKPSPEREEE